MENKVYSTPTMEITKFDITENILEMPTGPGDIIEDPYSVVETTIPGDIDFGDL